MTLTPDGLPPAGCEQQTCFHASKFLMHVGGAWLCADATLLAAGDTDGVVSAWDVPQSCLLSVAQVHEGCVSSCCWSSASSMCPLQANSSLASGSSSAAHSRSLGLISCSYDGSLSMLQVRAVLRLNDRSTS